MRTRTGHQVGLGHSRVGMAWLIDSTGPLCGCQQEAVERTVFKEGPNTGRKFWACPKQRDEGCGFFEWQDDNNNGTSGGGAGYSRTVPRKRTAANIVRYS